MPYTKQSISRLAVTVLMVLITAILLFSMIPAEAQAAGLVDETIDAANEYSKYPLKHYRLDFYVDNSWDWLPTKWLDAVIKAGEYNIFILTDVIWTGNVYISSFTGYLLQEAYSLDFIKGASGIIGEGMQSIAGVSKNGIDPNGLYAGFMLLIILAVGIYATYTGLFKRETSKAFQAITNLFVAFILSVGFIAYAPDYIGRINEFATDVSEASLAASGALMRAGTEGNDDRTGVALMRENLFNLQVKQPWLLMQFGDTDIANVGEERAESILSISPSEDRGKAREEVVKAEIENNDNPHLTVGETGNRFVMALFVLVFNVVISLFVLVLVGMMLFSQILFIIYAMLLPVSLLLSMLPTFGGMANKAIMKLFNVIMLRAGFTLVLMIAFTISTIVYRLSAAMSMPFLGIAVLQILTFGGVYFSIGKIMSSFALESSESNGMGRRFTRGPGMFMNHQLRRFNRNVGRAAGFAVGGAAGAVVGSAAARASTARGASAATGAGRADHSRSYEGNATGASRQSRSSRAGQFVGNVADTGNRMKDKATNLKQQVKDAPTNARFVAHEGKRKAGESVRSFASGITDARADRKAERQARQEERRQTMEHRRAVTGKNRGTTTTQAKNFTGTADRDRSRRPMTEKPPVQKLPDQQKQYTVKQDSLSAMKRKPTTHKTNNQSSSAYREEKSPTNKAPKTSEREPTSFYAEERARERANMKMGHTFRQKTDKRKDAKK